MQFDDASECTGIYRVRISGIEYLRVEEQSVLMVAHEYPDDRVKSGEYPNRSEAVRTVLNWMVEKGTGKDGDCLNNDPL